MTRQRESDTNQTFEQRLRKEAAAYRRVPPPELRRRIMATVRRETAVSNGGDVINRPSFAARRVFAAAAMILIVVLAATVLRPPTGQRPRDQAQPLSDGQAFATEKHPQLLQPLLDFAPRVVFDAKSPLDVEADRMLADARLAGRIIVDSLPFRGLAAEVNESRDF